MKKNENQVCNKSLRLSVCNNIFTKGSFHDACFLLFNITSDLSVQSEKSKKVGNAPSTTLLVDFLRTSYGGCSDILLLEEDMNFNLRAASISVSFLQIQELYIYIYQFQIQQIYDYITTSLFPICWNKYGDWTE